MSTNPVARRERKMRLALERAARAIGVVLEGPPVLFDDGLERLRLDITNALIRPVGQRPRSEYEREMQAMFRPVGDAPEGSNDR